MPPAPPAAPASPMRAALQVLLDGAPNSRSVFRHLAAVEVDLKRKDGDGRFLFDIAADKLRVILRQLDGLTGGKSSNPALTRLRSTVYDAIKARDRLDHQELLRRPLSSFLTPHKLEVNDASHSDFDRLQAQWAAVLGPGKSEPR